MNSASDISMAEVKSESWNSNICVTFCNYSTSDLHDTVLWNVFSNFHCGFTDSKSAITYLNELLALALADQIGFGLRYISLQSEQQSWIETNEHIISYNMLASLSLKIEPFKANYRELHVKRSFLIFLRFWLPLYSAI